MKQRQDTAAAGHDQQGNESAGIPGKRTLVESVTPTAAFDAAARGAPGELPYREEMQRAFGADFSSVRAFTGRDLTALGALAVTRGEDIVFAATDPDRDTVAHELTHVMQARTGGAGTAGAVSAPGDASEHEARSAAAVIRAGGAAPAVGTGSAEIQRREEPEAKPLEQHHPVTGSVQGTRLDWEGFNGLGMSLPNGADADAIREIYNAALLIEYNKMFPDIAAGIPQPDPTKGRSAKHERATAVADFTTAIMAAEQNLREDQLVDEAEDIRRKRFAANQYAIVATLKVESDDRYDQQGEGATLETFCNVYAYDVVTAMGGYLPRTWWTEDSVALLREGESVEATEAAAPQVNANALTVWMNTYGVNEFGWVKLATPLDAQDAANNGEIVVVVGRVEVGAGHINVVLAESEHRKAKQLAGGALVPLSTQAGGVNYAFSDESSAVEATTQWWTQDRYLDEGFFVFRGTPGAYPIAPPDQLGSKPQSP